MSERRALELMDGRGGRIGIVRVGVMLVVVMLSGVGHNKMVWNGIE